MRVEGWWSRWRRRRRFLAHIKTRTRDAQGRFAREGGYTVAGPIVRPSDRARVRRFLRSLDREG